MGHVVTIGEIILGMFVLAGFSSSFWALARIADALNQIDSRSEGFQRSLVRMEESAGHIQESARRTQESAQRTQESVERLARYLAIGPRP